MAAPSRFLSGVTNTKDKALSAVPVLDPTQVHVFFRDFDTYTAAEWVVTEVDTDADANVAVGADANIDGGCLAVRVEADELDSTFLQSNGEGFLFESGKKLWFKARWKVSDATDTAVLMGLQITDSTPLVASDGVFFRKADTSTTCNLIVEKNSTETSQTTATIANDTFVETAFVYDGDSSIELWLNDAQIASVATTNLPDDEELAISFGIANGAEGTETLTVDYIFVAKER